MRLSWIGALLFLASASLAKEDAFLGVSAAPLDDETRAHHGVPADVGEGVVLNVVHEGTAAAAAGFRPGDVLVFFDGKPVKSVEELIARVTAHGPGDEVSYQLRRGSGTIEGTLKLGQRPRDFEAAPEPPGAQPPAELDARMRRLQEEIDQVRRRALALRGPVLEIEREVHHPGLERWIAREEKALVEAREKGDAEKVRFHEARLGLLREMREAAPAGLRLGLLGGVGGERGMERRHDPERGHDLDDRVARLEKKVDEILERLGRK